MNRRGEKPTDLGGKQSTIAPVEIDYQNVVGQDDLTRFDRKKNKSNGNHHNGKNRSRRHHGNEKKSSNHSV
jgi:hypothetical protein